MKITEIKTIKEKVKVTVGYRCDICNKEHIGGSYPDTWHFFGAHHNDWGNDSCESWKYYLICSPKCYFAALSKAVDDFKKYTSTEIDDMHIEFVIELLKFINNKYLKGK